MQHPSAALTAMHAASLPPHFLQSQALGSPVGSTPQSQPTVSISAAPCSTLFVANLGQFVSEQELKELFNRYALNLLYISSRIKTNLSLSISETRHFNVHFVYNVKYFQGNMHSCKAYQRLCVLMTLTHVLICDALSFSQFLYLSY